MKASKEQPVGIVGAGISGLIAAFHLTQQGVPVRVFEARSRIGGRIITEREEGCPLPLDLGAEFVHGAAEPTLGVADATDTAMEPVADKHSRFDDGKFRDMGDVWERYARVLAGAENAPDETASEYLKRKKPSAADAELFRLIVEGFEAAPIDDVGVHSLAREASGLSSGGPEMRPTNGYGALVTALSGRIPPALMDLRLGAAVEQIAWRSDGGATLEVRESDGPKSFECAACVVTLPLGVLGSSEGEGSVRITPEVPALSRPLSLLAMGHVVKLVLVLREQEFLKKLPDAEFFHLPRGNFPTFWQRRLADLRIVTAWIGGSKARTIEAFDTRDLIDQVAADLATCCGVLPGEIRDGLVAAHHHDFSRDPFSLGAYPYVRPEGADCARELSTPVGNTLFFAGDAADQDHFGTVAGAIASGARAARHILAL